MTKTWTLPRDAIAKASAVWERGSPLSAVASRAAFAPVRVAIKGPAANERGTRYDDLRRWLESWRGAPAPLRIEWNTVNDRVLGTIRLPKAAYLDTVDDIARAASKSQQLEWFRQAVEETQPAFRSFMARRPHRVLAIGLDWPAVVAAAGWLSENPNSGIHPRLIPATGVHTKVVERYRRDIAEMAVVAGDGGHVTGRDWFAARFGLATKPLRVRMRFLDRSIPGYPIFSDVEVPTSEAARHQVQAERVLIVENEVPFLALPPMCGTVAILGNGNAAPTLIAEIPWAARTAIWYWGDIDTWGFVILDRIRAAVGGVSVTSVLMDRATLLAHREAWVREDSPVSAPVPHLTEEERSLYGDLCHDRLGRGVRLEQERVTIAKLMAALGC